MRARRRAESTEHRAARLEQMRAHNNERLATESEQECYHAFWGPRPVAWVQRIQQSDANWECTKSVNNLNRY